MMILCHIHGLAAAMRCSSDLHPKAQRDSRPNQIVDLIYTIEGQAVWAYYISAEFAMKHGLRAGVYHDEEPGEWERELQCACAICFADAHHGSFDDSHRWHFKTQS